MVDLMELVMDSPLTVSELYMFFAIEEQGRLVTVEGMTEILENKKRRWVQDKMFFLKQKGYLKITSGSLYTLSKKGRAYSLEFKQMVVRSRYEKSI